MALGPFIVGKIIESIRAGTADKEDLQNLTSRFGGLASSIPGHIANFQTTPQLLQQIQQTSDPNEAARLFSQMQKIQDEFQSSGMEGFLKAGGTRISPSRHSTYEGQDFMPFAQGPEILKALAPYSQAMDYGRMLAQDKAAGGGITVPGGLTAENYALNIGDDSFSERYRPSALLGSSQPGHGALLKMLGLPIPGQATLDVDPNAMADPSALALLGRLGNVPQFTDPANKYTNQDIQNYLGGAGAGVMNQLRNDFDVYGSPWAGGVGKTDRSMAMQLQGLQPGGYEQGLRDMFAQGGWQSDNPFFNMMAQPTGSTGLMEQMQPQAQIAQSMTPQQAQMMPQGGPQQGTIEQDALMDLLRRLSMGTGGA